MGQGAATMIPSLETERMWARPVRLEDAEQVQKIFPQWEIVKHLGAVVPWPYLKPFYNTNPFKSW
jgi:[ribosomal protein S5]-alanine N-acetyltransferase